MTLNELIYQLMLLRAKHSGLGIAHVETSMEGRPRGWLMGVVVDLDNPKKPVVILGGQEMVGE